MSRYPFAILLVMALSACDSADPAVDAGGSLDSGTDSGAASVCERDSDCSDSLFCNGEERCLPGDPMASAAGCLSNAAPCEVADCDETADTCDESCPDADGDGIDACSGDCDDEDGLIYPGSPEVCDFDVPRDEDCDPRTFGFLDIDGDGAADARCFNEDANGMRFGGTDCDDNNASISPTATERCDGSVDEDCDSLIDEGCLCSPEGSTRSCGPNPIGACRQGVETCTAAGWAACAGAVLPASSDTCDGTSDDDCDGSVDEGCACSDGDSRACGLGACAGSQTCSGGTWGACDGAAPTVEMCDGIDSDCDGTADADDPDVQGLGESCGSNDGVCMEGTQVCMGGALSCGGAFVGPSTETCNHIDENCNGRIDDGVAAPTCTVALTSDDLWCYTSGSADYACPGTIAGGAADQAPVMASFRTWRGDLGDQFTLEASLSFTLSDPEPRGGVILLLTPMHLLGPDVGGGPSGALGGLAELGPGVAVHLSADLNVISLLTNAGGGWTTAASGSTNPSFRTASNLTMSITRGATRLIAELHDGSAVPVDRVETTIGPTLADALYGPSSAYPRYFPALIIDNDGGLSVKVPSLSLTRQLNATRPHCVDCTIP